MVTCVDTVDTRDTCIMTPGHVAHVAAGHNNISPSAEAPELSFPAEVGLINYYV